MRLGLLSLASAVLAASSVVAQTPTTNGSFVTRCGTKFCLDGKPYYFAGANTYDVFTFGSSSGDTETQFMDKKKIDKHFDNLKRNGVMVLRTWMFSHETWHGFEPAKGQYSEQQFALFDYVIDSAKRTGIKLIPVFENYWEAYGGIDKRLEWEGLTGGHPGRAKFFNKEQCPGCFTQYKNYVEYALNRVNHYSGVAYKDETAIFAWELMNEPRNQDVSAVENKEGTTLRKWVDEMGAFIKSIDTNHLLGTGLEAHETRLKFGGDEGNPFIYIHQSPSIDFTSAHPYTDEEWAGPMTLPQTLDHIGQVISDSHEIVKKPAFIGEFNFHAQGNATKRAEWWEAVYDLIEDTDAGGSAFWWFSYANTDPTFGVTNGDPILEVFVEHGNTMRTKSGLPEIEFPAPIPSPTPLCADIAPEGEYTCEQQAGWGKCSEPWMDGFCNWSCERCPGQTPSPTPTAGTCPDIAPDTEYTCAQQAEWGKCTESWMDGWCLASCGKCPGSTTTTTPSTSTTTTTTASPEPTCEVRTSTVALPAVTITAPPSTVTVTVTRPQTTNTTKTSTPTTTTRTSTTTTLPPANCAARYGQCGGRNWTGATCCQTGSTCRVSNEFYSQCL
ncbi:hypothetical protein HK097_010520 [Rhizophlyctis rosea]|uniref:mannan endo-1,4-beta-mannosidase n=1 Tax=Rhizophlyctis rosea TaxID=64517 RepID=A0AAD5SI22_9FUNG|nr:hypothetical protein HK097_010520 [Rhizophlyctis rosea]